MKLTKLETDVVLGDDVFSDQELTEIEHICLERVKVSGEPDTHTGDNKTRKAFSTWIPKTVETNLLYQKMAMVSQAINNQFFNFDLTGFIEGGIFFHLYDQVGDHYDWHTDKTTRNGRQKDLVKQTLVLELTDPLEYEGCQTELMIDGIVTIPKKPGRFYCIPGYVSHRVTPLISGFRKALIAWVTGPEFV
jgi:predicted 2-oxoglutarate/Fe(II)-dependent dioxygenase YbiX